MSQWGVVYRKSMIFFFLNFFLNVSCLRVFASPNPVIRNWCLSERGEKEISVEGEIFKDYRIQKLGSASSLKSTSLGALYLKNGPDVEFPSRDGLFQNFVFAFQKTSDSEWHKIRESDFSGYRSQLVFRFPVQRDVKAVGIFVRDRKVDVRVQEGKRLPCLRSVEAYEERDAVIDTEPWFYAISTWDEGSPLNPLVHRWGGRFKVGDSLAEAVGQASGDSLRRRGLVDGLWSGEILDSGTQGIAQWILQEPLPAGLLLSGNYKHYQFIPADFYRGLYLLIHALKDRVAMLGACGGHQLLAMSLASFGWQDFSNEFTVDSLGQIDITCSTDPLYACQGLSGEECCYEGGSKNPYRRVARNVVGESMENPYQSAKDDLLFLGLPNAGFEAFFYHQDFLNPSRITGDFDIISTYPSDVPGLSRERSTLVQGIHLKGRPIYGTQFHWDETEPKSCDRTASAKNMDRVLKNFVTVALNRARAHNLSAARVSSVSKREEGKAKAIAALTDADLSTQWCSDANDQDPSFIFDFGKALYFSSVELVGAWGAERPLIYTSSDGLKWSKVRFHAETFENSQRRVREPCRLQKEPAFQDRSSRVEFLRFEKKALSRFVKLKFHSQTCIKEALVL